MTNILKSITAQIVLTVATNWVPVGTMSIQVPESKLLQVQQGQVQTNTFLVYEYAGQTNWHLIQVTNGPALKDHKLIEQLPAASQHPPPLPIHPPVPVQTNVGTVRIN